MNITYFILKILILCFGLFSPALYAFDDSKLPDLLSRFDQYAQNALDEWQVPGMAISIVKDGKIIYSKGFGVREMGKPERVDPHTLFQIGSVSKSFTTALLALLVDDGTIKWNDPVVNILPNFMMYDPWVTQAFQIEDLVCQRSGLPGYAGDPFVYLGVTRKQIVHALRFLKPVSSFRSEYAYQNGMFVAACELVEAKTSKSWDDLIKERLFKPLGMNESSIDPQVYLTTKNAASFHQWSTKGVSKLVSDLEFSLGMYSSIAPAGGINSTAYDMSKWLILMSQKGIFEGKQLISQENIARLFRPHIFISNLYNADLFYCLGWVYNDYNPYPFIWHSGGTGGAASMAGFITEEKLGIVILTNAKDNGLPAAMMRQFFDMYFEKPDKNWSTYILNEIKTKEVANAPPTNPFPPMPLENYIGTYHNDMYGDARVIVEANKLVLVLKGQKGIKAPLNHWNRDTFEFLGDLDDRGERPKATFTIGPLGKPTTMVIDILEESGTGTFRIK